MRRTHTPHLARTLALTVTLSAGLFAACGSDSGGAITSSPSPTTASTAVTTTSATALAGAATTPVSTPIQGHTRLTALTAADQGGFDRVTFQFQSGVPGYSVQYAQRPIQQDASGATVDVKGDNVLAVHLAGASGVDLSGGKVTKTYTGPTRFSPATPSLMELVQTGDFEDVLSWAVGTKGMPAFKVTADSASNRIIIDISH